MFIQPAFKMKSQTRMHEFIAQYSFGLMVSGKLMATHLPFLLRSDEGEMGVLYSHIARANRQCQHLEGAEVLIAFTGPHAYISPTWYANTPNVPTWNYTAVHVKGRVELCNENKLHNILNETIEQFEPNMPSPQKIMPQDYIDKLTPAIVGLKINITHIEGQEKLGQQKSKADQAGVYAKLANNDRPEDKLLAIYMAKHNIGIA